MTPFRLTGALERVRGSDEFTLKDASDVLLSLSSTDRRDFGRT